eukprot:14060272-Heterocapsa_arctica.AAC.1
MARGAAAKAVRNCVRRCVADGQWGPRGHLEDKTVCRLAGLTRCSPATRGGGGEGAAAEAIREGRDAIREIAPAAAGGEVRRGVLH